MNKLLLIIFLILSKSLPFGKGWGGVYAQAYASKAYYLVDSLDLNLIGEKDKKLIESGLLLYHNAKDDTSRVSAFDDICENMMHTDWTKFQLFQLELIENLLSNESENPKLSEVLVIKSLKMHLAVAYGNMGYIESSSGKTEDALMYYKRGLKIHQELDNKSGEASAFNNLGAFYKDQGEISKALKYHHKALEIRKGLADKSQIAYSYNNIGFIHATQGEIPQALEYYHKALKIREDINDKNGMATSYNNIGFVHKDQGDTKVAMEYFKKTLKIDIEEHNDDGMAYSYNNMGLVYRLNGDLDQALECFDKSLKLRAGLEDKYGMAMSYHNIGSILTIKAKDDKINQSEKDSLQKEGMKLMMLGVSLEQEIGSKSGESSSLGSIARIQMNQGYLTDAKKNAEKGLELAQAIGHVEYIQRNSAVLSEIFAKLGNYRQAYLMKNLATQMKDSLSAEASVKSVASQQAKYKYETQKVRDDSANEKKVALEKQKQKDQFKILLIVVVAAALVLILLIIIYRRLRITRKQKLVIEEQKEEVETQRDQIEGQKDEIEQKHEEIQESITYAKRIQNAILPPDSFMTQHLPNNFIYYQPKDVVAGDFYWMEVHNDIVFFAAADCTGHGVPGAMVSVVCHNALNRAVREFELRDTGKILDKVRELVLSTFEKSEEQMKDGMDICLCAWSKNKNELQFSGANNPLYLIKDGVLETIKGTKQPIGHVQDPKPFESHNVDLKDIHSFYLTTDGYADQFGGPKNKKFSYKQLRELLVENHSKPMDEQHDILKSELNQWIEQGNDEQIDDVCMIGLRLINNY